MTSSTRQEQHYNIEPQQNKKVAGQVECLGLTFEDELARRKYFMALFKESFMILSFV